MNIVTSAYIFVGLGGALGGELVARRIRVVTAADKVIADGPRQILFGVLHTLQQLEDLVVPHHP